MGVGRRVNGPMSIGRAGIPQGARACFCCGGARPRAASPPEESTTMSLRQQLAQEDRKRRRRVGRRPPRSAHSRDRDDCRPVSSETCPVIGRDFKVACVCRRRPYWRRRTTNATGRIAPKRSSRRSELLLPATAARSFGGGRGAAFNFSFFTFIGGPLIRLHKQISLHRRRRLL